jgi:hypothetical protein
MVVCALGSRCGWHERHCGREIDAVLADRI